MNYATRLISFYKHPTDTMNQLLLNNKTSKIFEIFLTSFVIVFALFMSYRKIYGNPGSVTEHFYYYPIITLPFLITYSFLGFLLFKEISNKFRFHFLYSILIISYSSVFGLAIMNICSIIHLYMKLSAATIGIAYLIFVLCSRIVFNIKIKKVGFKKILIKSIGESVFALVAFLVTIFIEQII